MMRRRNQAPRTAAVCTSRARPDLHSRRIANEKHTETKIGSRRRWQLDDVRVTRSPIERDRKRVP